MRFSPQWLDELRARADIVSVVSQHVQLKQSGRRYWGLCPFHGEKTASFSVDPDRQMYYCFGCKAGGSVIQFVMDIEHLEFVDAVKHLAEQVHLELPQATYESDYERRKSERERLLSANVEAARFYHAQLWKQESAQVLSYLHGRGLDDGTIVKFGLGATPPGWDGATRYLLDKGYTVEELVRACITVQRDGKTYDMFRARAIFPIIDARGSVLGFGGRALGDAKPKYLNSSDTPVFNKRLGVYAANLLRKQRGLRRVILVEGYMDVVSLVQHGVAGVAATLGTSLTVEQARLLKRYAPEIWVAYDGDAAGQHAIERALDIFDAEGIPARVLVFPDGLDPDEFIRRDGLEAFEQLTPLSAVDYRIRRAAQGLDLSTPEGRMRYAMACAVFLKKVSEPVELDSYIQRLMIETGFPREVLMQQVGRSAAAPNPAEQSIRRRERVQQDQQDFLPDHVKAEQSILSLLSSGRMDASLVRAQDFTLPLHRQMAQALLEGQTPSALLDAIEDDAQRAQAAQIMQSEPQGEEGVTLQIVSDCLDRMRRHRLQAKIDELQAELPKLQGEARKAALSQLMEMEGMLRAKAGRKG